MDGEVDDIFKSFVSSKLKQLGMSGHTSRDLEKSMLQSAIDKLDGKTDLDSSKENVNSDSDHKRNKVKKEKKLKKHKKEKKLKKQKKEKDKKRDKESKKTDRHFKQPSSNKHLKSSLKEKVFKDGPDDIIKTKSPASYYETVKKIERIEKLSLKVQETEVEQKLNKVENDNDKKLQLKSSQKDANSINNEVKPPDTTKNTLKTETSFTDNKPKLPDSIKVALKNDLVENKPETGLQNKVSEIADNSVALNGTVSLPNETTVSETTPVNSTALPDATTSSTNTAVVNEKSETSLETKTSNEVSKEKSKSPKRRKHSRSHRSRSHSPKHRKHSRSHRSRSRSRSPSRKRSKHSHSRHRSRSPKHKHHHHHHHKSSDRKHRSSRHRRSSSPLISSRDKMKLLEIAKANVLAQHQAGVTASSLSAESKAMLRSGGVTLEQLTGVCKDISDGKRAVLANIATAMSEKPSKVHHPFQVREAPSISINIKNALPPIPAKPVSQLTKEFPVSSGSQHQRKEVLEEVYGKWEPIVKDQETKSSMQALLEEKVFPDAPSTDNTLSIKEVIAQRVSAVRELESNPTNAKAVKNMMESQNKIDHWTASQIIPGRFTGSTGLQPIPKRELEKGQPAWVNQKALNAGKQVGGIGKSLLQKMGWKEGESLGRTKFGGMVEPIKVQIKTDRKGLSSCMEMPAASPAPPRRPPGGGGGTVVLRDLSGKHPVSAIMEICSKRRWKAPDFVLVPQAGPSHHSSFIFKVMVNGVYYQPAVPSANKKQAKAQAATAALQALGLIPN